MYKRNFIQLVNIQKQIRNPYLKAYIWDVESAVDRTKIQMFICLKSDNFVHN